MAEKKRTDVVRFFREVRQEGSKVTWTPRQEVIVTTIFVLIFVLLAATFLFFVDAVAKRAVCTTLNFDQATSCLLTGAPREEQTQ